MIKTALITGVSKGIGNSIKSELLNSNYRVIGISRTKQTNIGDNYFHLKADISKKDGIYLIDKYINKNVNKLDLLILNAGGVNKFGYFEDLNMEDWEMAINLNLKANVNLIKNLLPYLKKSESSQIVFVGSAVSTNPGYANPHYIATKVALLALAKNLSLVYAKDKIRVNTISPGPVITDSMINNIKSTKPINKNLDEYKAEFFDIEKSKIPLGNFVDKKDIAKFILFIDNEYSSSITGQNFVIDGGKNRHL